MEKNKKSGKVEQIDSYIFRCEEVTKASGKGDCDNPEKLVTEIIGLYEGEIKNIKNEIKIYNNYEPTFQDELDDIILLCAKLKNYKYNLDMDYEKMLHQLEVARLTQPKISAKANSIQKQSTNIEVSLSVTFNETRNKINQIDDTIFSEDDKETLIGYLSTLDNLKEKEDHNKFWEKSKKVLAFLADKGADAAIAMLPYIISGLTKNVN